MRFAAHNDGNDHSDGDALDNVVISQDGLEISGGNDTSCLTTIERPITGGRRWAAFRILRDPLLDSYSHECMSKVNVGVVPLWVLEQDWYDEHRVARPAVSGWTCKDSSLATVQEQAACTACFLSLANGCLSGAGFGVGKSSASTAVGIREMYRNGTTLWQPPDGIQQLQVDSNSKCVTSFDVGDTVGVLVDCDSHRVQFYRNGWEWGPGYTSPQFDYCGALTIPPLSFVVDFNHPSAMIGGDNGGHVELLPDEPAPCYCCRIWSGDTSFALCLH